MVDPALERRIVNDFHFPLGCYPTEAMAPVPGYTVTFEPADGSDPAVDFAGPNMGEELEEWPDRYVFDILISHERLRPLCRALFALLPGRFYPILDVLGHDAYREIDPYISYELVGIERFLDALRLYDAFFFEDGLVGFGAMSLEPFFYVFTDEHKIVTVRTTPEMKDRMERLLATFDLLTVEEIKGADAAAHEHRGVIVAPEENQVVLSGDEVIERLRDAWDLQLNVDSTTNLDADGVELGITGWQCIVRCTPKDENAPDYYAETLLTAANLAEAEDIAERAVAPQNAAGEQWEQVDVIRADRVSFEQIEEWLSSGAPGGGAGSSAARSYSRDKAGLLDLRWLTGDPSSNANTKPER